MYLEKNGGMMEREEATPPEVKEPIEQPNEKQETFGITTDDEMGSGPGDAPGRVEVVEPLAEDPVPEVRGPAAGNNRQNNRRHCQCQIPSPPPT